MSIQQDVEQTELDPEPIDPVLLAVLANRFEGIAREMTNTLLRSGRSTVLNMARDFSCSIVTADNQLLSAAEGLPVHVFGSHLQAEAMTELHPDLTEGDAFLHNDPYMGNTHHADHTILVPVYVDGEFLFTAVAKAHQGDCGNSVPTTYSAFATDIYDEGALNFPCVRIQRDYEDIDDVIRMCRRRIRVPDQWYGDYLAELGAARIAERRLKELAAKYGVPMLKRFVREWLDYSERRMRHAIEQLPSGRIVNEGRHDPVPAVPDGIPIKVIIDVDAGAGTVDIDLRDNIDSVPAGLNESKACAINNAVAGLFNVLGPDIPHNAGSFRRVRVHLRENCVVGIPVHPTSCSVATTNVGDRLVNITQSAFAQVGDGAGLAEGGNSMGVGMAVISGNDWRRGGEPYVNQLFAGNSGGPAGPECDGWVTYCLPVVAALMYRDSVELDEQRYPMHVESLELLQDGGGAGRFRGAPPSRIVYSTKRDPMTIAYTADGSVTPPRGVLGGGSGMGASVTKVDVNGEEITLPTLGKEVLEPGEKIIGVESGGGGYGPPTERDPERVRLDVLEGWVSREKAHELYGVALTGEIEDESLAVDEAATAALREEPPAAR
jgi:N-methylhydantoinase B